MSESLSILLDHVTRRRWAMHLPILQQMMDVVERHYGNIKLEQTEIEKITAAKTAKGTDDRGFEITRDGTAIIPIGGVIAKYSRNVNGVSQPRGISVETLRAQLDTAMTNPRVNSVFLHIESPGGYIEGLPDFADEVYQASFEKPVVAFADDLCASAAYWIASQANVIYSNQSAQVGSIGVYMIAMDSSAAAESKGLKFHIIRSGQNKGIGATGVEITDANIEYLQNNVNADYEMFLSAVMRGRGVKGLGDEDLRALADGRLFAASKAKSSRLIDSVMTLQAALSSELPQIRNETTVTAGASAEHYSNQKKEIRMKDEKTQGDAAETQKIASDAASQERTRITAITSALSNEAFAVDRNKAISEGLSLPEAKALAFGTSEKLRADQKVQMQGKLDVATEKLAAISAGGSDVTASEASDSETKAEASGDDGQVETYVAAVENFQADGESFAKAHSKAVKKFPLSHEAWKAQNTRKKPD